jgi:hypothetical protein
MTTGSFFEFSETVPRSLLSILRNEKTGNWPLKLATAFFGAAGGSDKTAGSGGNLVPFEPI